MTGAISFLVVGAFLLLILFLFVRRTGTAPRSARDLSDAHEALSALQSELLPDWFVDRLFSTEDWQFAHDQGGVGMATIFSRERKRVALSWLKQTQQHVARLMDFHLRTARQRPDLKPSAEIKITLEYVQFQLLCKLLSGMIRMAGPTRVRSVAGHAVNIAAHLGTISEKVLADSDHGVPVNVEAR
ncbi:MAG: hypothetical protein L0387_39565 [Acidobacteria bacterium]|nr:hypothetical protein [Acidobacteriota bacterium]MCI0722909.1 hypothetical protein [Acidobacteriota bacterium]